MPGPYSRTASPPWLSRFNTEEENRRIMVELERRRQEFVRELQAHRPAASESRTISMDMEAMSGSPGWIEEAATIPAHILAQAQVRSNNYVAKTDLEPVKGWVLSESGEAAAPPNYPVGPATDDDIDAGWQETKATGVEEEHSSAWFEAGVRFAERRLGVKEKD